MTDPQPAWWQRAVCYQIYPRSFQDSDGDGIGDLQGIIERLDYLNDGSERSLGIDAIWLNPVYPSPQYDFGYDIMDHQAIDPQYGTMEDFERLLYEAHQRGIRILMDMVPSVTSHLHPWFVESRASRRSPKRDWYIWRDAPRPGKRPNNWQGVFGGPAWTWDVKTQQYYYHNSLPEQPDLNWRNPEVAQAILGAMEFWLRKGVDGFRIDVLNYVYKDERLRSNPHCCGRRPYEMQRHVYDKDRPEAVDAGIRMRQLVDRYPGGMLVAEVYVNDPREAARYYGEHGEGANLVFNFSFMNAPFSAPRLRHEVDRWEQAIGARGWPCYFLSNHDNSRHASRFAAGRATTARARVAAALLLTLRGTPFLYMGEEIGMLDGIVGRHERLDPVGVHYWPFHPGRDVARTPMQWSAAPYAGFSSTRPWLPVHPAFATVNVAAQEADAGSLLRWYRRLIWLRKGSAALSFGGYQALDGVPGGVFAYLRVAGEERVLVALNFAARRRCFGLPGRGSGRCLLGWPERAGDAVDLGHIELEPYGVLIVAL
ncbi:MAG TPA: alpha-glucosidase [Anaerolineae bacterium]|nr:alpha-glucosidase [Anaerolineae bacterium]HOR00873.1 alpha-glucosidase [Anaerolineae bacterium]HPL28165.1 alpha-glucosidase [Anaerolineae bacterium]